MPPPQCRTVYRDYDARNDTKHHERQRLTNAGERGERKGDGDGGGRRSDTVVVVGSRYADTFAGCERPGQRRVNWRGVPSRDSHHDPAPPSREFSRAPLLRPVTSSTLLKRYGCHRYVTPGTCAISRYRAARLCEMTRLTATRLLNF